MTCYAQVMVLLVQRQWSWQRMSLCKPYNWKAVQVKHDIVLRVVRLIMSSASQVLATSKLQVWHSAIKVRFQADI